MLCDPSVSAVWRESAVQGKKKRSRGYMDLLNAELQYIIDGEWRVNPAENQENDERGLANNVFHGKSCRL